VFVVAVATAADGVAAGAPPPDSGYEVGARAGYGVPFGAEAAGAPMAHLARWSVPAAIDVGYRVNPNLYAGLLFEYRWLGLDDNGLGCNRSPVDGPGACSGSSMRVGANVQWRSRADTQLAPWIGAGIGYEWIAVAYGPGGGPAFTSSARGPEIARLEIGADGRVLPDLVVGPVVAWSAGRFSTHDIFPSTSGSGGAFHYWLVVGVRVAFTVR
jgi:hypothetical protein